MGGAEEKGGKRSLSRARLGQRAIGRNAHRAREAAGGHRDGGAHGGRCFGRRFARALAVLRQVNERFVQAGRDEPRVVLNKHGARLRGCSRIGLKVGRHEHQLRAQRAADEARHGRAHAGAAGHVVGGGYHADAADSDGQRFELRPRELRDRREERVHVDADPRPVQHAGRVQLAAQRVDGAGRRCEHRGRQARAGGLERRRFRVRRRVFALRLGEEGRAFRHFVDDAANPLRVHAAHPSFCVGEHRVALARAGCCSRHSCGCLSRCGLVQPLVLRKALHVLRVVVRIGGCVHLGWPVHRWLLALHKITKNVQHEAKGAQSGGTRTARSHAHA